MALYYDMFTRWLTPDVKTYGSATSACDEGVKVDQALEFFHLMQHSWETTDIVSYKDAHRRLCEMSWLCELRRAKQLFDKLLSDGVLLHGAHVLW